MLLDMYEHYEHCLANLRRNETYIDAPASQSISFREKQADPMAKHVAEVFTPKVFALVKEKWILQEIMLFGTYKMDVTAHHMALV